MSQAITVNFLLLPWILFVLSSPLYAEEEDGESSAKPQATAFVPDFIDQARKDVMLKTWESMMGRDFKQQHERCSGKIEADLAVIKGKIIAEGDKPSTLTDKLNAVVKDLRTAVAPAKGELVEMGTKRALKATFQRDHNAYLRDKPAQALAQQYSFERAVEVTVPIATAVDSLIETIVAKGVALGDDKDRYGMESKSIVVYRVSSPLESVNKIVDGCFEAFLLKKCGSTGEGSKKCRSEFLVFGYQLSASGSASAYDRIGGWTFSSPGWGGVLYQPLEDLASDAPLNMIGTISIGAKRWVDAAVQEKP